MFHNTCSTGFTAGSHTWLAKSANHGNQQITTRMLNSTLRAPQPFLMYSFHYIMPNRSFSICTVNAILPTSDGTSSHSSTCMSNLQYTHLFAITFYSIEIKFTITHFAITFCFNTQVTQQLSLWNDVDQSVYGTSSMRITSS